MSGISLPSRTVACQYATSLCRGWGGSYEGKQPQLWQRALQVNGFSRSFFRGRVESAHGVDHSTAETIGKNVLSQSFLVAPAFNEPVDLCSSTLIIHLRVKRDANDWFQKLKRRFHCFMTSLRSVLAIRLGGMQF